MSRGYPRFFLSNITDGKSPGKYIIHSIEPFLIIKVYDHPDALKSTWLEFLTSNFSLELLNVPHDPNREPDKKITECFHKAAKWYRKYLPKDSQNT